MKKKEVFEAQCQAMRAKNSGEIPEKKPPGRAETSTAQFMSVKEAAAGIGRSEWWTRQYFRRLEDTLKQPSLDAKRGKREYITVTIPIHVFEREKAKFGKKK